MQDRSIPYSLALEQRKNLAALAQTSVASAIHISRRKPAAANEIWINTEIEAPRAVLVDSYLAWVRANDGLPRSNTVPAHMFSQWSVPFAMRVLIQSGFSLGNIINLGCDISVNGTLRQGEKLLLSGELVQVDESAERTELSVRVVTRTQRDDRAIDALIHCMLPKQAPSEPPPPRPGAETRWETAGAWAVDEHDGLRFALLTGDFNPLHWADRVARHSLFKQKVLHGFASLSLSWVALQGREPPGQVIRRISARFVRPVLLPSSSMYVFRSAPRSSGMRRYALKNTQHQTFILGEYRAG